jgi:hypothetical protein
MESKRRTRLRFINWCFIVLPSEYTFGSGVIESSDAPQNQAKSRQIFRCRRGRLCVSQRSDPHCDFDLRADGPVSHQVSAGFDGDQRDGRLALGPMTALKLIPASLIDSRDTVGRIFSKSLLEEIIDDHNRGLVF